MVFILRDYEREDVVSGKLDISSQSLKVFEWTTWFDNIPTDEERKDYIES